MTEAKTKTTRAPENRQIDILVIGAGVSGMYLAYKFRDAGLQFQGLEAGSDVGGTWYWNRYPGCRCDAPSIEYSYGFDPQMEQEWSFTETMAAQPEIERYLQHVAKRHDLKKHFHFSTRVTSAHYDEKTARWTVQTDCGDKYSAKWCIMATGALSAPNFPPIPGLDKYAGTLIHTGLWPREGVDLAGKTVCVIGTGSSGIQSIPLIAKAAKHLTVLQRTPQYALPAGLEPMDKDFESYVKSRYRELRKMQRATKLGVSGFLRPSPAAGGGTQAVGEGALPDLTVFRDPVLNQQMRDKFAADVRARVKDPKIAEMLIPKDYPFGCKRLILEIDYFETYNRDNVKLVDLTKGAITEILPTGVRTEQGDFPCDVLIFATGFDAFTGPVTRIDIRGNGGKTLQEKWAAGPRAYLGLIAAGFPNMLFVHGPGSPSVLTNMITTSEIQIDIITKIMRHLHDNKIAAMDATVDAEEKWLDEVHHAAEGSQYTAPSCRSWYLGSNIAGKKRIFMPYVGGLNVYESKCEDVIASGYPGFVLTPAKAA